MALNVPDVGENVALEAFVNKTAPQNLVLRLYQNNITPSDTDVAGTYTESTFAGYAALTLTGATWNAAASGTITYSAQQTFTRNATGAAENVYGYYVTQSASGILVWSERDAGAPFIIINNGDAVKITPTISAN
jgi:hypothetical protein